jgi:hypothetical protein
MNFSLMMRGTKDGMTPDDFHAKCDGKGENVVIVQSSDTNEVFGG